MRYWWIGWPNWRYRRSSCGECVIVYSLTHKGKRRLPASKEDPSNSYPNAGMCPR